MLMLWTFAVLLGAVAGREVCFDKLGCFSDDAPWSGTLDRPLKALPWSPAQINTRFLLYTNENPDNYQLITSDASNIRNSNFRTNRKTRIIIHGFIDKGEENWLSDMCKNMFRVESVNCICVDWKGGSRTTYTQATQNVRVVGAEVALLVNVLQRPAHTVSMLGGCCCVTTKSHCCNKV
uniref:Triacylglycerol lipase n=1 Tax=Ailuropoda melanoleuca TaxID=9646 RepID=A0A7N5P802_AILME